MLTTRSNYHRSRLPKIGDIGHIRLDQYANRKCIVSHFPLTDSPDYRFSIGIHTCYVRFLDNGEVHRFSGFWFEPVDFC